MHTEKLILKSAQEVNNYLKRMPAWQYAIVGYSENDELLKIGTWIFSHTFYDAVSELFQWQTHREKAMWVGGEQGSDTEGSWVLKGLPEYYQCLPQDLYTDPVIEDVSDIDSVFESRLRYYFDGGQDYLIIEPDYQEYNLLSPWLQEFLSEYYTDRTSA